MHECDKRIRFTCDWIFNQLVILSDGKVVCGCADPYGERPLGHLDSSSLLDIWRSPLVKQIRRELNQGHSCFCDRCGLKRLLEPGEEIPRQPVDLDVLPRIFLEPTVLCNLSCYQAVCGRDSGIVQTRSRPQFPFSQLKGMLREVGEQLVRLDFFNYGDPLVHPEAVEMIEYIKAEYPGIYLYLSTNGLMLDPGKSKRLVQSRLDEITFSVDGPDPETYLRYRRGGDFAKVLNIMTEFIKERDRTGHEIPYINWRYILFRWNDSRRQMNRARKLAEKIGIDRLTWEITDHPAEAMSRKYQPDSRHWRRIYHEIWDTSQIGNALRSRRLRAKIDVRQAAIRGRPGAKTTVPVKIKNVGGELWRQQTLSGRRIIRLGAQLFTADAVLVDLNFARAFLSRPLRKGDTDVITIDLPPLEKAGEYRLKFDMVSEGIDWFEKGGSPVDWRRFTVT